VRTRCAYDDDPSPEMLTIIAEAGTYVVRIPGDQAGPPPKLAPDGSSLIVVRLLPSDDPHGPPETVLVLPSP
jgi:hypothetical protein